ncbi:uncharacterized protein MELLADRAFT_102844 [Melampsora larici-populina 98AG31]|uniref:RING-type domain-containing protein n=1 Tax=Melampsora larici-populina (strain 98AG31 / pathotype 3-4-7) TaxID=747676 RepID=F4R9K4_MELLP|nr:uncharacterized protein MELLADRAFT_102844 [Melampsora larici-populina 98AG31]EGG11133.1 hypothetical protein MELLADRAFT_102844 [Melampsora larici-populina 98AG31]
MYRANHWEEYATDLLRRATQATLDLLNHLTSISQPHNIDLSILYRLPDIGSRPWYSLRAYVGLLTHHSFAVEEEKNVECGICIEFLMVRERFIQFPCHHSHRIHETCFHLMAIARSKKDILCISGLDKNDNNKFGIEQPADLKCA